MSNGKWYERVKRILKDRKINMEEFGSRLGWSQSTISMKLSGNRASTIDDVLMIANKLNVSVSDLVGDDDDLFVVNDDEKAYLEFYRGLSETEKSLLRRMLTEGD